MTLDVDVVPDAIDYLVAAGTVGAAVVATVAVVVTGRQGQEQQRLLVAAQERDRAERRADFELGILLELSTLAQGAWRWRQFLTDHEDVSRARALLLALPQDLLPVLRALSEGGIVERPAALAVFDAEEQGGNWIRPVQNAVDQELREAITERRDLEPPVSERLASRRWYDPRTWGR